MKSNGGEKNRAVVETKEGWWRQKSNGGDKRAMVEKKSNSGDKIAVVEFKEQWWRQKSSERRNRKKKSIAVEEKKD